MVTQPMIVAHGVCYHCYGATLAAVITAIRSDHLLEVFTAEAWLEKYLNA